MIASPRADGGIWPRTNRLLPWGLAGFLAMVWLLPFDAITLPISLPLDSKLDRPALLLLALIWVAALATLPRPLRPRVHLTPIHAALLVFFLLAVASAIFNAGMLIRVQDFDLVVKKLAVLASFTFFFVIAASSLRPREVDRFITLMLGLACVAAVGTIVEYRLQFNPFYMWTQRIPLNVALPGDLYSRDSIGRLTVYGPSGQPLEAATMFGLALPFALVRTLRGTTGQRLLYACIAAVIVAGALSTVRKTGLIAPLAGVAVLIAYRPRLMVRRLLPLGVTFFFIAHLLAPGAMGSLLGQLQGQYLFGTLSTQDRASDYGGVSPDVTAHPIIGRGYQSYDPRKYRILDNQYLNLIVGVGFVGLFGYLLVLASVAVLAHKAVRRTAPGRAPPALAVASATTVLAVATALFDVLSFPHIPYLFLFIAALLVVSSRSEATATAALRSAGATLPSRARVSEPLPVRG